MARGLFDQKIHHASRQLQGGAPKGKRGNSDGDPGVESEYQLNLILISSIAIVARSRLGNASMLRVLSAFVEQSKSQFNLKLNSVRGSVLQKKVSYYPSTPSTMS